MVKQTLSKGKSNATGSLYHTPPPMPRVAGINDCRRPLRRSRRNMRRPMDRGLRQPLAAVLAILVWLLTPIGLAQESNQRDRTDRERQPPSRTSSSRELFIPFEDLNVLLGGPTERVFMTRQEYEQLQARAKTTSHEEIPLGAAILRADYIADLAEGRAAVTGKLTIDVLTEGLHAIPLELAGLGVRTVELDGAQAALAVNASKQPVALVEGVGRHELTLHMVVPVSMTAALQALTLQVPVPAATTFRLTVPGNVEVKSGAAIISRQVDGEGNSTTFEIVPARGSMSLVLSLNNRMLRDKSTVLAKSVLIDEVTAAYEKLHATLSLNVLHGAIDELRLFIPDEFEVNSVASPLLARWFVEPVDGRKELVVIFRETALDLTTVNISAVRTPPKLAQWTLPKFELKNVAAHTSVIGLLVEENLATEVLVFDALIPIDSSLLSAALPESILRAEPGAPTVRPIAAFYAPGTQYSLAARYEPRPTKLNTTSNLLLTLSDNGLEIDGGFALRPETERLFSVDFSAPLDWQVDKVSLPDGTSLKHERFNEQEIARYRVLLPKGIPPGTQQDIVFHAAWTPQSWMGAWQKQSIAFPMFSVLDAARQEGALAVHVEGDFEVAPASTSELTVLSESDLKRFGIGSAASSIAYRFDDTKWSATLDVSRTPARLTARVMSFFSIQTDAILAHYELTFDCQRARTRQVALELPASTPAEISVRGLSGTIVKETSSSEADGKRTWTVSLAEKQFGRIRLAVDFSQRLVEPEAKGLALPIALARGVAYQSGMVAVEGNADFDVTLAEHPKPIDVGELVDAEYQVGKRLLGAYGYVGESATVRIDIARRPVHPLPSTVVERSELATLVSASGTSQTSARFQLRTKAQYLEVRLPDSATLWTMLLDGKPALPQRQGDRVIVALATVGASTARDLRIVYEMPCQSVSLRGKVEFFAPQLRQRETATTESLPVPVADLKWELTLPEGYRVVQVDGNVFWEPRQSAFSSLGSLLKILHRLGGGMSGGLVLSTQIAREASVAYDRTPRLEFESAPKSNAPLSGGTAAEFGESTRQSGARYAQEAKTPQPFQQPTFQANTEAASTPQTPPVTALPTPDPFEAPMDDPAKLSTSVPRSNLGSRVAEDSGARKSEIRWAMEGMRSLNIDLAHHQTGESVQFQSLGVEPYARVTLVNQRRLDWVAIAVGILVGLLGLLLMTSGTWVKTWFVFGVVLVALLLTPVTGLPNELAQVSEAMFVAVCLLTIVYLLRGSFRNKKIWPDSFSGIRLTGWTPVAARTTSMIGLVSALVLQSEAVAQNDRVEQFIKDIQAQRIDGLEELLPLVARESLKTPLAIPHDAIVVPYTPGAEVPRDGSQKLLVPYAQYVELWNLANPDKRLSQKKPPAEYAISGAKYTTKLEGDTFLVVSGALTIEVFVDHDVSIPLPLSGGVLQRAALDGKAARLELMQPAPKSGEPLALLSGASGTVNTASTPEASAYGSTPEASAYGSTPEASAYGSQATTFAPSQGASSSELLVLHVEGKGRKQLELTVCMKLERRGGWRVVDGRLPSHAACALVISVPKPQTEVRLGVAFDRGNRETIEPNETIETVLAGDGVFSIQWRPKIAEAIIDQGLTVQSQSVFDVQEDGLKLAWTGTFEFRRSRRESFALEVPGDYLVEKVIGANVRGWRTKSVDGNQSVDLDLLKAASDRETITLMLSRKTTNRQTQPEQFDVPVVAVPDAMLHQGSLSIRRSALLEVRTGAIEGLRRADTQELSAPVAHASSDSPLPLKPFQSYQFSQTPFKLQLSAGPMQMSANVKQQTLVKISPREMSVESRLLLDIQNRPLHRLRLAVPTEMEVTRPAMSQPFEWSLTEQNGRQIVELYFSSGLQGTFQFVLLGSIKVASTQPPAPSGSALAPLPIPRFEVLDIQGQQGDIIVQADPAFDVRTERLRNCEVALIDSVAPWLEARQRELARAVVHYSSAEYDGLLRVVVRPALISGFSVSNVRLTDRAIEETIYFEFTIRSAGIREINFVVPASMRDANIQAPLLRQKTVTPVNAAPDAPVRFRLELQDDLMGQVKIVVENDRMLTPGPQTVPVPVIETGRTDRRFITLENVGSSELVVGDKQAVDALVRSQSQWRMLANLLGEKATEAFMVREDGGAPKLVYDTKQRAVVETVGARIALSQAVMVVDASGAYRAMQEYRVENRTEQYLEIEMPAGSELWTAWAADEPVKPMSVTAAQGASMGGYLVRIPLVKTATGDLDYGVILKYGGLMPRPANLSTTKFPLIKTKNINVELSQVRLRLPQSQKWFNFGGSMGRVLSENDLTAGWLSYKTRQLSELTQLLNGSGSVDLFSKARATNNLKQLGLALQDYESQYRDTSQANRELKQQLDANTAALSQAQEQLTRQQVEAESGDTLTNRAKIMNSFQSQARDRSLNIVQQLGNNFRAIEPSVTDNKKTESQFDRGWIDQNQLGGKRDALEAEGRSRVALGDLMQDKAGKLIPDPFAAAAQLAAPEVARLKESRGEELAKNKAERVLNELDDVRSQTERYQKRLEQQGQASIAQATPPQDARGRSMGGGMGMAGGMHGAATANVPALGGFDARARTSGEQNQSLDLQLRFDSAGQPLVLAPQADEAQSQPRVGQSPIRAAGYLASLDVELPARGQEFFFTTPRGETEITVQSAPTDLYDRLIAIGSILGIALVGWILLRLLARGRSQSFPKFVTTAMLFMAGLFSVVSGVLPVYGCVAILVAIGMALSKADRG